MYLLAQRKRTCDGVYDTAGHLTEALAAARVDGGVRREVRG